MGFSGSDFGGFRWEGFESGAPSRKKPSRPKKPRKEIKNPAARIAVNLAVTAVFGFLYFYLELPAINLQSEDFYAFALLLCAVYCVSAVMTANFKGQSVKQYLNFLKKQCAVPFFLAIALLVVSIVGNIAGSVLFRARSYAQLLPFESGNFAAEVAEISYNQIPMLDRDSAERLGDRQLGQLSDMVSQFEVVDDYTQINYKGRPVRIATLEYADIIRWFTNRAGGLPAYIIVDMVTQSAELVRLPAGQGIKYTTVEHFGRNLYRHLRFSYPTYMFAQPVMEVNEGGTPYWICPRLVKTIGLFGGVDVNGAVLVNAITGESQYYEEVPDWVDNLYSAGLIIRQYDYYGMYHNGFWNSIFGQRDVTVTTSGYNYIAINDDVYVYTGITSTGGDQSNIGFILTNQRTKETRFYTSAGATEYSAMASANGELQNLRYQATFPLLLNVGGQPTYFMAMKDAAELVKKYAMVNVQQYTIVATGDTVAECEQAYLAMLNQQGIVDGSASLSGTEKVNGTVSQIRTAVLNGNSWYYIRLIGSSVYYTISAADAPLAVILSEGDQVTITYHPGDGAILTAVAVELR